MADLMTLPETAIQYAERLTRLKGHAAPPGTGPAGETCGSCKYRASVMGGNKAFSKCDLMKHKRTHGSASDIRKKDPACSRWEKR
jgi:hypothetical protein